MPIRAHCPSCKAVLNIPDDVAGHKVQCTGCTTTFTAPIRATPLVAEPALASPASPGSTPYGPRHDEPRSRRRRDDDDSDLEDRPIRKRKRSRKKSSSALPFILAGIGLLILVVIGLGYGVYYLLHAKSPDAAKNGSTDSSWQVQGGAGPASVNGNTFTITAARKTSGRTPLDSGIDVDFVVGPGATSTYILIIQSGNDSYAYRMNPLEWTVGQHRLPLQLNTFGPRFGRMGGGPMEVWIEERGIGGFGGGGRIVSNKLIVN